MSTRFRFGRTMLVLAAVAVLAVACGGTDAGSTSEALPEGEGGLTKVKVGVLPIGDVAPIYYGMEKGFFAEEGLEIEPVTAQGGAAVLPSVLTGEFQFGFSNVVSLMLAQQEGASVKIIAGGANGAVSAERGANMLVVSGASGIESVQDMAGKTFAVNALKNLGEVTIKATLEKAGVDASGIQLVEIPFPDMNAAIEAGRADVAWHVEPFITIGEKAGLKPIANPMYETVSNMTIAAYFVSSQFLETNGDVVERFYRALERSMEAASADDAGIRQSISTFTETPPEVLGEMVLARWEAALNRESMEVVGRYATEYELLDEEPDLDGLIWSK